MENKSKILMVGPNTSSQGGISSVIKMYSDFNLNSGNVIYLASYSDGNLFLKVVFYCLFIIRYLFVLFFDKDINLVHIHTASRGSFLRKSLALIIAKLFNKKVLVHIHGAEFSLFYKESAQNVQSLITDILNKCDGIIVLSKQWKESISKICSNENIKVLYNPTFIMDVKKINSSKVKVLFMGRLGQRKGVYDIIEAAKNISSDVCIELYGDGEQEECQKIIKDNNLQFKVKIMGWISGDKKNEAFQSSDIYILPSYNEGLPISILEAMSYGLPIISTPVGGTAEAVQDGLNGFLIEPGDCMLLAEKIDLLASDKSLREIMGQESHRIAKEKFDIKIVLEQLMEIYNETIS